MIWRQASARCRELEWETKLRHLQGVDDHGHSALAMRGLGAVDPNGFGIVDGDGENAALRCALSVAAGLGSQRGGGRGRGRVTFSPLSAG